MTTETANVVNLPAVHQAGDFDPLAPQHFEHSQRVAKMFASSELVPQHLRGKLADCLIAYAIAKRTREEPLVVMQNIYFVSGRAGWHTPYMIAKANRSGVFAKRINWKTEGAGENMRVTAFATLGDSGEQVDATVSMAMAKAEGWTRNSKYQSMPEQMLRYRAAAMLIRLFCPEVMMGLPVADEMDDYTVVRGPSTAIDITNSATPAAAVTGALNALDLGQEADQHTAPAVSDASPPDAAASPESTAAPTGAHDPLAALDGHLHTRATAILAAIGAAKSVRDLDKIQLAQRATLDDISVASPAAHETIMQASRDRIAKMAGG